MQIVVKVLVAQLCLTLQSHELYLTRLLCPWNSPGKNTGVGCHSLLQGIFPTQGPNPSLPHCRWILCCSQITLCLFQSTAIFVEICSSFTESASFLNPFLFDTKSQGHLLLIGGTKSDCTVPILTES